MKAIFDLDNKLKENGIPHEMIPCWDGWQICYPSQKKCVGDVICHSGSYGNRNDLLEAMGFGINRKDDGDTVVGYLTVAEAFNYFDRQYKADCSRKRNRSFA